LIYWNKRSNNDSLCNKYIGCLCFCVAGCEYRDIAFLVDSSGSIVEDPGLATFQLMKQFIKQVIGRIDIGPTQNLVGLVQFSETAITAFTFNTFANSSKAEIYRLVDDMPNLDQNTNIALGLRSLVWLLVIY